MQQSVASTLGPSLCEKGRDGAVHRAHVLHLALQINPHDGAVCHPPCADRGPKQKKNLPPGPAAN